MGLLTANKTVRQLIAAVRFVGVSHDASNKHFLGKNCRERLADLDTFLAACLTAKQSSLQLA